MAKRKKKEIDEEFEVIEEEVIVPDDVERIINDVAGADWSVVVDRYNAEGFREKIGTFPLEQFNADAVAQQYGGGKFQLTFKDEQKKIRKNATCTYAKPLPKQQTPKDESNNRYVELLQKQVDMAREEAKSTNVAMINMMNQVLNTMMTLQNKPSEPKRDPIEDIIKINNLMNQGKPKNPFEDIQSMVNLLQTGMKFGKDMSAASSDVEPSQYLANKLIDAFGGNIGNIVNGLANLGKKSIAQAPNVTAMENAQAGLQAFQNNIPHPSASLPVKKKETLKMEYKDGIEKKIIETLRENEQVLTGCAKVDMNIESVAEGVVNKLEENQSDADMFLKYFDESVAQENFERILKFIPSFTKYVEYMTSLLNTVVDFLKSGQEGEIENAQRTDTVHRDEQPDGNDVAEIDTDSKPSKVGTVDKAGS